jgi:predicted peptidase
VDTAFKILNQVVQTYSIDKNRIYATGQSMGGMISFYFNANHPDVFAASLFVSSQWDVKVLDPLAQMKFFYIVSAGDEKASGGMQELGAMLSKKGKEFANTEFAADLPHAVQEQNIQRLIKQGSSINFVRFTASTVAPKDYMNERGAEHMYAFDRAYQLEGVRNWLFKQSKAVAAPAAAQ